MSCPTIETTGSDKTVYWKGEGDVQLRASFKIEDGWPCIGEIALGKGAGWVCLAKDLRPEFDIKTGIRRPEIKHGQPHEDRWWNYSDTPLVHPDDIRSASAIFACIELVGQIDGARAEISCPGVQIGQFAGKLLFTVYNGSNLLRVELVARTDKDSVAYMYRAGLAGFEPETLHWIDPQRNSHCFRPDGSTDAEPVRVRARH